MSSPSSWSIRQDVAGPTISSVRYKPSATPTESKPGPILAEVAGTLIRMFVFVIVPTYFASAMTA